MTPHELLEHFKSRQDAIIDLIREVVEIESPSGDVAGSGAVADWVERAARATAAPLTVERFEAEGVGTHLVIRAFEGTGKPFLMMGHTDTVHPIGSLAKNPTRIEGDKFYGCGTFDMKANIVVALEALRYFAESGTRPAGPINMLLACDEEVGSRTGREHVEREARLAEACLVLEPSAAGRVKTGRKGTGMYTLRARGVPAHAGLDPEKGASAILELSQQIPRLHELNAPERGTTVNVCTITGGTTTNVIPEHAECSVDVRFSTVAEAERIDGLIKKIEPVDSRVSLDVLGGINRPPMERTEGVVALFEKARELAASFDYDLGETQVGGASDGNFVGALGVPVIDGLGIAGDGAHRLDEHILVSDIAPRATLITGLLKQA